MSFSLGFLSCIFLCQYHTVLIIYVVQSEVREHDSCSSVLLSQDCRRFGQCMTLGAWGWCTGMTQKDGTGREEGGGFRMGKHMYICDIYLWQIHVDVRQNQYNIVK